MNLLVVAATELELKLVKDRVRIVVTGVGPGNAAHALTRAIEQRRPATIVAIGIGGAYPGSGLAIGDVVCAESECYGDLGVETPEGFLELSIVTTRFPMQIFPTERRAPFVTVSTCSGTDARSQAVWQRTLGAVESMEGAAIAQVAAAYGIPVGQIRGISNMTGNRDLSAWKIKEAADAAQHALLAWLTSSSQMQLKQG